MLGVELLAREGGDQLVAAHADVPVDPPERQHLAALSERPVPRDRVVVVRVDERAVDVEDRAAGHGLTPTLWRCPSCLPSQNSSTILAQNAGRSSGLREETRPSSTTTSSSTHVAAGVADVGLQRRPRRDRAPAQDVGLDQRPRAVADHADRLGLLEEAADEGDGVLVHAQEVGVGDAARQHEPVVVGRARVGHRAVDRERVALVEVVEGLDLAGPRWRSARACRPRPRRPSTARSARPARCPRGRRGTRCACPAACRPCRSSLGYPSVHRSHTRGSAAGRTRGMGTSSRHPRPADRRRRRHVLRAQRDQAQRDSPAGIVAPDEGPRWATPSQHAGEQSREGARSRSRRRAAGPPAAPPRRPATAASAARPRAAGRSRPSPSGSPTGLVRTSAYAPTHLDAPLGLIKALQREICPLSRRGTALQLSGRRANNPPPHQPRRPIWGASVVKGHCDCAGTRSSVTAPSPIPRPEPAAAAAVADARARAAPARPQPAADLIVRPVTQTPTEAIDYAALTTRLRRAPRRRRAVSARGREPVPRAEVPGPRRRHVRALEADRPREGRELDPPAVRRRAGQPAGARRAAGCATPSASC